MCLGNLFNPLQVIEIVRKNVRVLCESQLATDRGRQTLLDSTSSTMAQSVDDLRLYRMFQRVFSRMLWNGGRGLTDCLGVDQRYRCIFSYLNIYFGAFDLTC